MTRLELAQKYMRGYGIELGAFHSPWPKANNATVLYVDSKTTMQLKNWIENDPNLKPTDHYLQALVPTELIDNAELCSLIPSSSQFFIVASHVLEHCFDPLRALENWMRVLKVGGHVLMAVPNKKHTFDRERELTNYDDLLALYQTQDPEAWLQIKRKVFEEYFRIVDHTSPEQMQLKIEENIRNGSDIHFNVWDEVTFLDFLRRASRELFGFAIQEYRSSHHEIFAVLTRLT